MFGWAEPPPRPPAALLPPAAVPGLGEQLEDLTCFRLGLERRHRTAFAVIDRMGSWRGESHVCRLPPVAPDIPWPQTWVCSCGQAWLNPPWYTAWQPITAAEFDNRGGHRGGRWHAGPEGADPGDECECPECRRRRA